MCQRRHVGVGWPGLRSTKLCWRKWRLYTTSLWPRSILRCHQQVCLRLERLPHQFRSRLPSSVPRCERRLASLPSSDSAKLAPRLQDCSPLLTSAKLCSSPLPSSQEQAGRHSSHDLPSDMTEEIGALAMIS